MHEAGHPKPMLGDNLERGRREGDAGGEIQAHLWPIHVEVRRKPSQLSSRYPPPRDIMSPDFYNLYLVKSTLQTLKILNKGFPSGWLCERCFPTLESPPSSITPFQIPLTSKMKLKSHFPPRAVFPDHSSSEQYPLL